MSILEIESKYPQTTEFIYSECATRLKQRKLELRLTDAEIAEGGGYDRKVVNRIFNNTKTRNNPYLIPPAYSTPLVNKLNLKDDTELFWGNMGEAYIESLFCNLLTDILDEWKYSEDVYKGKPFGSAKADIIETVLLDDVRYARIYSVVAGFEAVGPDKDYIPLSPYADIKNEKQMSYAERNKVRENAIQRLFKNTMPLAMFRDFFQGMNDAGENKGFSRLEKRLDTFVDKSLLPFLKANIPDEKSLGMRVYSIVAADLANYVESGLINQMRESHGFEKFSSPECDEILKSLMSSGIAYVSRLEKLQDRLDALHRKEKFGR